MPINKLGEHFEEIQKKLFEFHFRFNCLSVCQLLLFLGGDFLCRKVGKSNLKTKTML